MSAKDTAGLRRRPLYLLLPVLLGGVVTWAFWPRGVPVDLQEIGAGTVRDLIVEEGRTRLRERHVVSAPFDGTVERITAEPGDAVTAGTVLVRLHPGAAGLLDPARSAELAGRLRSADAELRVAQASAAAAQALEDRSAAEARRLATLATRGLVAAAQVESARATANVDAAGTRAALARVRMLRSTRDALEEMWTLQGASGEQADAVSLKSPVSGRIIRRLVESAGPVRAGQPLLELGDPHALEVVVEMLTADAARIASATPVRLLHWGGPEPLSAHVDRIEPGGYVKVSALGVEEQRVLARIALDDPAIPQALGDGYRLEAEFLVAQQQAAVVVPTAALFRRGNDWAVYRVQDGRARQSVIRLGLSGEGAAVVLTGLAAGERVVLYPDDRLADGVRVRARAAAE